jgi:hypothetical protein
MNNEQIKERLNDLDKECVVKEKAGAKAKRRFELALAALMEAERELGAVLQKRSAFEGRQDVLYPSLERP